jgi:hypothetical protein
MPLNDNLVVRQWQEFRLTAAQELRQYFNLDEELQNRLDQAADDLQEQDNDNLNQLEWQQASGMRPVDEHEASPDLPIIDHLTNGRDLGTDCTDLPFVHSSQLNRLQRMRFNMAVEALQLRKQLLLIVNSTTAELPLLAIYSQIGYFWGVGLLAMLWLFQRF